MRLRVATFNVHHCEGRDGVVDVARCADAIRRTEADIVALQELDRGFARSGGVDQPAALASMTELHVDFHPTVRRGDADYGIALASTEPISGRFHLLPSADREEPRGAIVARHRGLGIIATHLSTRRRARALQIPALAELVARLGPPAVLLGDLNDRRRALSPLERAGLRVAPGDEHTVVGRRGRRRIDHVLTAGPAEALRTWTLPSEGSDHVPLVAEIEI
jgi:endonuclease/exonuclease/phosphatase family metal-dependent hydrolase